MDTKTKYFTVYNMKYAMELKNRGHKVVETLGVWGWSNLSPRLYAD